MQAPPREDQLSGGMTDFEGVDMPTVPEALVNVRASLAGVTFGRLVVASRAGDYVNRDGHRQAQWLCLCQCGNATAPVRANKLKAGLIRSCGCLKRDVTIARNSRCSPRQGACIQGDAIVSSLHRLPGRGSRVGIRPLRPRRTHRPSQAGRTYGPIQPQPKPLSAHVRALPPRIRRCPCCISKTRLMVARSTATRDQHRRVIARDKPPCAICLLPIDYSLRHPDPMSYTVDHVIPLAKGGTDTLDNKQSAHRTCNRTKWHHTDEDTVPAFTYVTWRVW